MAKNWKVGEAVKAVKSGNKADILDIGRRFPLFANLAAQLNDAGVQLLDCIPEYVSARKLESVLKGDVQPTEEEEETEVEEKPAKKKAPAKNTKTKASKKEEEDEYSGKSAKELYDMCKEAGLKVKPKQTKEIYIEALKSAENEVEEDDDWGDEEEEAPKKPAKKTAKKKAPKKEVEEDDDDDWEV